MPRSAKRDIASTKLLRENGILLDSRSFISLPSLRDGKPHLYLRGRDMELQRDRVFKRDKGRCQIKGPHCGEVAIETDHKQGGLVGRCDCLHNLQAVCIAD